MQQSRRSAGRQVALLIQMDYKGFENKKGRRARGSPEDVIRMYMMRAENFWLEARQRRNHALLVSLGWLVAGVPLWRLYTLVLPTHDSALAISAALVTWGTVWSSMSVRLTSLRCFRCGEPAFDNPYFSIAEAKCKHCGVQPH